MAGHSKWASMPKDNIKRAVDKGAGGDSADYQELRYEGFGPSGIGIVVEVSTDNTNRSAMEVRTAFSKNMKTPHLLRINPELRRKICIAGNDIRIGDQNG